MEVKAFGKRDQIGYLFGNLAGDFTFTLCSGFMLKFYTDVMSVDAYIVGILMMVAQVLDAFTDIGMGQLVDRTEATKDGKFRPWIRKIAGPVALTSFLMYASWFQNMGMTFKIVWMFVTYLLYCSIFYTMIIIPYGSMASAISNDPVDRAKLSNWRHIGGTLAMTFINVIMPIAVYYVNEDGQEIFSGTRMSIAAFCFSVAAFVLYMCCYYMTTERVKVPQTSHKFNFKDFADELLKNRAMIGIILMILLQEAANSGFHGMSSYIFPNYFRSAASQSVSSVMETIITLVIACFVVHLVAKIGKKEVTIVGACISAATLFLALVVHTGNVSVWLLFYAFVTLGLALINPMAFALVTDIVDDTEVRTGKRVDGAIYGFYSFARKFGQALSSGIRGIMLSVIGYTAATAFDNDVVNNIYNVTCIVPMIGFALMALVVAVVYPLNKKRVEENVAILESRRGEKGE